MTDLEKIQLLEKENSDLRHQVAELEAKVNEVQDLKQEMQALTKKEQDLVAVLTKTRDEIEHSVQVAHRFKTAYRDAISNAMTQTVRPYAKAVKQAKKRHKKTS